MHILIGATSVFQLGGMQRATVDLANGLAELGHRVTLVGEADSEPVTYYPLRDEVTVIDIVPRYRRFDLKYIPVKLAFKVCLHGSRFITGLTRRRLCQALEWHAANGNRVDTWKELCHDLSPDIVIGISPDSFTLLSRALKDGRIPLITSNHSNPWQDYSAHRWSANIVDIQYRKSAPEIAAANTVLLPEFLEFFAPAVREKTFVIGNSVPQISPDCRANPGLDSKIKTVVAAGRYVEVKDHRTLVRAFSAIRNSFPGWQLKIFGEGPLKSELQALIDDLSLQDCVFLCDFTENISSEYAASHILAMPSRYEGFGLAVAEAMAHGLPCVGFDDTSGVRSLIVHGKTGFLADGSNRVAGMSGYLGKLMADAELRNRFGVAAVVEASRYSPQRIYQQWNACLDKILPGN